MLKKNLYQQIYALKNNLYLSNIIINGIAKNKKFMTLIFSKNNAYFFNLKSKLC